MSVDCLLNRVMTAIFKYIHNYYIWLLLKTSNQKDVLSEWLVYCVEVNNLQIISSSKLLSNVAKRSGSQWKSSSIVFEGKFLKEISSFIFFFARNLENQKISHNEFSLRLKHSVDSFLGQRFIKRLHLPSPSFLHFLVADFCQISRFNIIFLKYFSLLKIRR